MTWRCWRDLIVAAVNEAMDKVDEVSASAMSSSQAAWADRCLDCSS